MPMKLIKPMLAFLTAVLALSSCETIRVRNMHDRMLRAELGEHSDVLDIARAKIFFADRPYSYIGSPGSIRMSLYLNPNRNNRESIIAVRDGLIAFIDNNWDKWEPGRRGIFPGGFEIGFLLKEGGETIFIYKLYNYYHVWEEQWVGCEGVEYQTKNNICVWRLASITGICRRLARAFGLSATYATA